MQISEVKSKIKRCNDEVTNDNRTQAQTKGVKGNPRWGSKTEKILKTKHFSQGGKTEGVQTTSNNIVCRTGLGNSDVEYFIRTQGHKV